MIGSKDYTTPVEIKTVENKKPQSKKPYAILGIVLVIVVIFFCVRKNKQDATTITPYQFLQKMVTEIDDNHSQQLDDYENSNKYTLYNGETSQKYMDIEVYEKEYDAIKRYNQLKQINGYIQEIDESQQFQKFLVHVESPYYVSDSYRDKNIVFIFDANIDSKLKNQFSQIALSLSKEYTVKPVSSVTLETESLSAQAIKNILIKFMDKIDNTLAMEIINKDIDMDAWEDDIDYLKDIPLFETYYQRWNHWLDEVQSKSVENSDVQNQVIAQMHEKIYNQGEYVVGQDILSGYYIAVHQNQPEMSGIYQEYSWQQDTIFYLENGRNVTVAPSVSLYSLDHSPKLNTEGFTSGVFKVGQHLQPGKYQLSAQTLYPCDYWIIDQSQLSDFIKNMSNRYHSRYYKKIKNDQTATIELKENEYLFLMNGELEKK
ncbi:hypothetical protein [Candidatus Stoquefichus sp. SB1]|uniref:hypothetical protein n=1 Tax=Candidatus Stoquefichus sp. SB1 TaxID=1658109 RepID=UPI00067EA81A|nr:hypothetical protein [Candidatus Stoquefichus sp. SB1]